MYTAPSMIRMITWSPCDHNPDDGGSTHLWNVAYCDITCCYNPQGSHLCLINTLCNNTRKHGPWPKNRTIYFADHSLTRLSNYSLIHARYFHGGMFFIHLLSQCFNRFLIIGVIWSLKSVLEHKYVCHCAEICMLWF
jgi:hypothetical protein